MNCPIAGCTEKAPPRGILCPMHFQLAPLSARSRLQLLFDPEKMPEQQSPTYLATAAQAVEAAAKRWRLVMAVPRLKALTVKRPWGWLMAAGHKPIENRKWAPPKAMIGQRFVIHSGQEIDRDGAELARKLGIEVTADAWDTGAVALATIDRVFGSSATMREEPLRTSPWYFGHLAWVLRDVIRIPAVPIGGQQSFWDVPESTARVVWYRSHVAQAMLQ